MKMKFIWLFFIFYISSLSADDTFIESNYIESSKENSYAEKLGISETDFSQYKSLLADPSAFKLGTSDPLLVLGVNSVSIKDRRRYAKLAVIREKKRLESILSFQRLYVEEANKVFKNTPLLDPQIVMELEKKRNKAQSIQDLLMNKPNKFTNINFYQMFAKIDCVAECISVLSGILDEISSNRAKLDIYITSKVKSIEIKKWAKKLNIPISLVRIKVITLNHYKGKSHIKGLVLKKNGIVL